MLKDALPVISARHGEQSLEVARLFRSLGFAYRGRGKLAEADEAVRRAIAIEEKVKESGGGPGVS